MKIPQVADKPMQVEEVEWRAKWWHDLWMINRAKDGIHHPSTHINPFVVPPPLRADGKTYCDKCSLSMVPYKDLPEKVKQSDRDIVNNVIACDNAWEARKE